MGQIALLPATDKEIMKTGMERQASMLPYFWWGAVNSCSFATLELFYDYNQLIEGGWLIELFYHWEKGNKMDEDCKVRISMMFF